MATVSSLWSRLGRVATLVATPLEPSHYIALFRPLAATHVRQARVESIDDEAPGVRTLTLRPGRRWPKHRAGQHVQIGLAIDGRLATRTFSISSPPERDDGCITITVKAQGRVSKALVETVEVGSFLTVSVPAGDFVLAADASRVLFVTAGSGITPIASMVRSLAARAELRDVVHIHYARTPADEIFGEELRELAVRNAGYRLIVVHTSVDSRRFSAERLVEWVPDWQSRAAWACGPAGLLGAITSCFDRAGLAAALHVERFGATLAPADETATGGEVRLTASGVRTRADGRTPLLRIAEDAGLSPPHGCRMGICHSCDATMVAGCVRDLRTNARITEPGTRIQICVCAAAGDVELDL